MQALRAMPQTHQQLNTAAFLSLLKGKLTKTLIFEGKDQHFINFRSVISSDNGRGMQSLLSCEVEKEEEEKKEVEVEKGVLGANGNKGKQQEKEKLQKKNKKVKKGGEGEEEKENKSEKIGVRESKEIKKRIVAVA